MPYATGTCRGCGGAPVDGHSRCAPCLARRREIDRETREERRQKKQCVTCGAKAAKKRAYRKAHLAYYAARMRRAA